MGRPPRYQTVSISTNLSFCLAAKRVEAAIQREDADRAFAVARLYRKCFPRTPHAYYLEYWTHVQMGEPDPVRVLPLLREGWKRAPYFPPLADALCTMLLRADLTSLQPRLRREALAVVEQVVALWGEGYSTHMCRSEAAQLDGDLGMALQHAEMARARLDEGHRPETLGLARVGLCFSTIPGQEAEGLRLLQRAADEYRHSIPHMYLYILLEHVDPDRAARHLEVAGRLWEMKMWPLDRAIRESRVLLERHIELTGAAPLRERFVGSPAQASR